jgi:hypothetical protein
MNIHGSVVLGINFGLRENTNEYLNALKAVTVHGRDDCDHGNSGRGSYIDMEGWDKVSADGKKTSLTNDIKLEDNPVGFLKTGSSSLNGTSDIKQENIEKDCVNEGEGTHSC